MASWQTKTIRDVTNLIKDGTHGTHKDSPGGIPLLSAKDVNGGKVIFDNSPRLISQNEFSSIHKNYKLANGDILLTIVGSLGRVAMIEDYLDNYTFQRSVAILRFKCDVVESRFAYYTLRAHAFQKELIKRESKGAQGGVYLGEIAKIKINLPSKPEQQRIVEILEVWDEYLNLLDKKIVLQERLKTGLMQRLLAGKARVPGFSGEWKEMKVSDTFDFISTYSHSKAQMTYQTGGPESVYCIHYGDIHTKFDSYIEMNNHNVPHLLENEQIPEGKLLRQGDVIVADASEDYKGVGSSIEIADLRQRQCIAGLHTFALRAKSDVLSLGYGALLFRNRNVHESLMKIATYSKVYGITKTGFAKIKVTLPPLEEQTKIADILKTLDDAIDLMRGKKQSVQRQKKYLLKNLISGDIRTHENLQVKGIN